MTTRRGRCRGGMMARSIGRSSSNAPKSQVCVPRCLPSSSARSLSLSLSLFLSLSLSLCIYLRGLSARFARASARMHGAAAPHMISV